MRDFRDDLKSLSKGLASSRKIGSRVVSHRLAKSLRPLFELACKKGYLNLIKANDSAALLNLYDKYCKEYGIPFIVLRNGPESGKFEVEYELSDDAGKPTGTQIQLFTDLQKAKGWIAECLVDSVC